MSNDVRKFISSVKVCVKANPLEDDLILKRKNEMNDRIAQLITKLADAEQNANKTDEKVMGSIKKLSDKLEGIKTKLSNFISTLTKEDKTTADTKRSKKETDNHTKFRNEAKSTDLGVDKNDDAKNKTKSGKGEEKSSKNKGGFKKTQEIECTSNSDIPSAVTSKSIKLGSAKKAKNHKEQKQTGNEPEKKEDKTKGGRKDKEKKPEKQSDKKQDGSEKVGDFKGKLQISLKSNKQKKDKLREKPAEDSNKQTEDEAMKTSTEKLESIEAEVSDVTSEVEVASTHRTEEIASDLEEDSFVVDYINVQNAQVKPRDKPIPGILKKSSTAGKFEKSEIPNVESSQALSNHEIKEDNQMQGELFEAIRGWAGEEADDLSFEPRCSLKVLQKNEDGWWLAEDISGKTGLVPMNFLKPINPKKTSKVSDDRKVAVQEAFAEVFQLEDEEYAQSQPSVDGENDARIQSQNQTEVDAERAAAVRKEREQITRDAFAEVFRLEDAAEEKISKFTQQGAVGETINRLADDTETTDMVASLYDDDTFTLDELVQENLTETSQTKVNAEMRSHGSVSNQPDGSGNAADVSRAVSVKERVNQWEEKVKAKRPTDITQGSSDVAVKKQDDKNAHETEVEKIESNENQQGDKEDDESFEDEQETTEVDEEETKRKPKEEHLDDDEEEDELEDEEVSELSESQGDANRVPMQSVSPKKNELLHSAAKWLYQSNAKLLKSLEPLPPSVRISTLATVDWTRYNYQTFLVPRLGISHLMLVDLIYDTNERKVVRRPARIQRIVHIQKCTNMPTFEESNFAVQERTVRLCLFDGQKPLSNIVRIPMVPTDRGKKIWQPKPQNLLRESRPNDVPAELFVRFNYADSNVYLLIETGISVLKSFQSEEQPVELSLGWILVPFYDEKGVILTHRSVDYVMQPGTPYEEPVFTEDPAKEETVRSRMQNLLFGKDPQITVRICQPNREQNAKLETLPDILLGMCAYLPVMSLYWELLGHELFGSKSSGTKDSVFLRHVTPSCALLPYVADSPLLMEALRVSWNEVFKELSSTQKKDLEKLQKAYSDHFLRVIYPLVCLLNVIPTGPTSSAVFEKKTDQVLSMLRQTQADPVKFYMNADHKFMAFTTREFTCPVRIIG